MKNIKLNLPVAILLASIIFGGFYYATQVNKQKSIEKQQELKIKHDCREKYPGTGFWTAGEYERCISVIK